MTERIQKVLETAKAYVEQGAPEAQEDGHSVGYYVCCSRPASGRHEDDCRWDALRRAVEDASR